MCRVNRHGANCAVAAGFPGFGVHAHVTEIRRAARDDVTKINLPRARFAGSDGSRSAVGSSGRQTTLTIDASVVGFFGLCSSFRMFCIRRSKVIYYAIDQNRLDTKCDPWSMKIDGSGCQELSDEVKKLAHKLADQIDVSALLKRERDALGEEPGADASGDLESALRGRSESAGM